MESLNNLTDEELVDLLNQGSGAAFTAIYDRYKVQLASNLLRMLKSADLAEEVLQELFMSLWEHRERIDRQQSVAGYLYRSAVNMSKNVYRKVAGDQRMREQLLLHFEYAQRSVDDYIHGKEAREALDRLINQLPPQQRQVYCLCKLEGKSYKEVSQLLNITETTVNSHIRNANKFLRGQLGNHPELIAVLLTTLMVQAIG